MAAGFATLSGGDTVSFNLDPSQISAVQTALRNLSARDTDFTVYNPDGGTTVSRAPAQTDAVILDSVNGSTGTSLSGSFNHPALWVGNQGNDTFSIYGQGQTIIAGDGNNTINFTGSGEVSVGGGNNRITIGTGGHSGNVGDDSERAAGQRGRGDDRGGDDHTTHGGNGAGAMTVIAGSGNNLVDARGTSGNDALYGGSGSATLLGGGGMDSFFGGSGSTSMVGGSNWGFFTGGSGNDTMIAHTVPMGHGHGHEDEGEAGHGHGVDQNVFNFDAAVGGHHEIDGYNSTAPGGDTAIHLTFTNYGLTPNQIVADSAVVGHDTVITLPGAGGNPTTTITIKDFTGIADWNVNSH